MDYAAHQIALENLATAASEVKALTAAEEAIKRGAGTEAGPVPFSAITSAIPAVSKAIAATLVPGHPNRPRKEIADILSAVSVDVLALCALNVVYTVAMGSKTLTIALAIIGRSVSVEYYAALARKVDPKAVALLSRHAGGARRMRGLRGAAMQLSRIIERRGGPDPLAWEDSFHIALAAPLVGCVLEACPLFTLVRDTTRAPDDRPYTLALSEDALQGLLAARGEPWVRPRILPMVTLPAPWTSPVDPPYLTEANRLWVRAVRRVRGTAKAKLARAWEQPSLTPFRTALDTLGQAAFRVDTTILEAVTWAHCQGLAVGGVPQSRPVEVIEPDKKELEGLSKEQRKVVWDSYWEKRNLNLSNKVQSAGLHHEIGNLHLLAGYDRIYQPHYADFRGRLYPVSALSHHREDAIRACFRFAEPAHLGEHGEKWLLRHVANCAAGEAYGKLDKQSWKDREEWTRSNHELIRGVAENWRERPELWTRTDHPFAFLQGCLEYTRIASSSGAASGLIIGLDGTCSGLQHYAAALRSPSEGALVNLTPGEHPSDVYAAVASQVVRILEGLRTSADNGTHTEKDRAVAQAWLDLGVTRSTVKRQTMTFAYSSEVFGFRQQLYDDLIAPLNRKVVSGLLPRNPLDHEGDRGWHASLLMARCIWRALSGVVVGASSGMLWIKTLASLLAKHDRHMEWVSPSGFPVVHSYKAHKGKQVETFLGRRKVTLRVEEELPTLLPHKQRSASAPNVIHSLDAAHLHLTTEAMAGAGVTQLAMIHDSFGTVPGHVETMDRVLREQFVKMYESYDIFAELRDKALSLLPQSVHADVPAVPVQGDLDIRSVLGSSYFFC